MEFATSIFGLFIIVLCIIPFWVMRKNRKKKEQDLVNGLMSIADSYNSDVYSYDNGTEFSIGISSVKNYVFFYKKKHETVSEQCVPLNAIRKCQVDSIERSIKTKGGNESIIDRLELTFIPKDKNILPSRFEFYNSDENLQLNGELPLIRKWEAIINKILWG